MIVSRNVALLLAVVATAEAAEFHVSPAGSDANPGTATKPVQSLAAAQKLARAGAGREAVTVVVAPGTYYLPETLVFGSEDSGTAAAPVLYCAAKEGTAVISGGSRLELKWTAGAGGVWSAKTPDGLSLDQCFLNGVRLPMARYPNFDPGVRPYGGYAADAFSKERAAKWADPAGGYIHAMHRAHWGGYHYRITGKNEKGEVTYEGGWQNNRQMGMHPQHRFVENIREELDAPGEWFHDAKTSTLYCLPPAGTDLATSVVEVVRLRHLVEFRGTKEKPVRFVTLQGFTFRHAARTFMDVKEPLLRSDWTIYRGGAVFFNGAEDCAVTDSEFDQPGGNAVFVNKWNRRVRIAGCHLHDVGASAVAFVGDPKSVRNPLFEYGERNDYAAIDKTPGPQTDDYPADCTVEDCLIERMGVVEKQATGVQVSMAMGITIRHCTISEASRAGINISEGTFGGHTIEFCDVFDTVRETGDHGSFNSWGRDRFWGLKNAPDAELPQLALLDVVKKNTIRNSRWRCDHGWDVDLDDGSSNYEIYNNLFLHGGLKLREGFHRRVWNNIAVNNTLHPHVWYKNCGDIVTNNIWMAAYRPAVMHKEKWGETVDRNLFTSEADRTRFAANGCDANSIAGDPLFVDPAKGDYRVKDGSPALKLGFVNFPMDQFGVMKPSLRAIARTPELPIIGKAEKSSEPTPARASTRVLAWCGATVRTIGGEEFSAYGVSRESGGVVLQRVAAGSPLADAGLRADDLVQSVNGKPVKTTADLFREAAAGGDLKTGYVRGQQNATATVKDAPRVGTESAASAFQRFAPVATPLGIRALTTRPGTANEKVDVLTDGQLAKNYGPVMANGVANGLYKADLGVAREVGAIRTWSYAQNGNRGAQRFALFGSNAAQDPGWNLEGESFVALGTVDAHCDGDFLATSFARPSGAPLGTFRWIVWSCDPVTGAQENTAFQEFQVLPAGKR